MATKWPICSKSLSYSKIRTRRKCSRPATSITSRRASPILLAMKARRSPRSSLSASRTRQSLWPLRSSVRRNHRRLQRPKRNRRIHKNLVLLRAWPGVVVLVDQLQRTLAPQVPRQDHHADETAWTIGGSLGEDRVRAALVPGAAGAVAGRMPFGVDADAALDQAADARPLMAMQERAATGRECHAVAAQQQLALRHGLKRCRKFLLRPDIFTNECGAAGAGRCKLKPPAGDAMYARLDQCFVFAVPSLAVADHFALDRHRTMHNENHARSRRQGDFGGATWQHIFVKAENWKHVGLNKSPAGSSRGEKNTASLTPALSAALSPQRERKQTSAKGVNPCLGCHQSFAIPTRSISSLHLRMSARKRALSSSGELALASMPSSAYLDLISGVARISRKWRFNTPTTEAGTPAGAHMAFQDATS